MAAVKIKKGDQVIILSGKDKGKTGEVIRSLPEASRLVVRGINVVKRHQRPTATNPQGGIVEKELPLHVSNVAILDPKDKKPTRVGFKTLSDGRKVRVAKRSGEVLDQ